MDPTLYVRTLCGEIARQLYAMIARFYNAAAGCKLHTAAVIAYASTVLCHTAYNPYFRTNRKIFLATDFIAELLQHLPDPRLRLIRRYGL